MLRQIDFLQPSLLTVAAGILFTSGWVILGSRSTGFEVFGMHIAPYSPVAHPVSGLGLGNTAKAMNAVFIGTGWLLSYGTVACLLSLKPSFASGSAFFGPLLVSSGVGAVVCGCWSIDRTVAHGFGYLLAAGVPAIGFLEAGLALRSPDLKWLSAWLIIAGPTTLCLFALSLISFDPEKARRGVGYAGLIQRILLSEVLVTFAAIGVAAATRN